MSQHNGRFDNSRVQQDLVQIGDAGDKGAIAIVVKFETVAESSIDEAVNEASDSDEFPGMEPLKHQREDILGANALEAFRRAIVIHEFIF
jgi:hypothetical protein